MPLHFTGASPQVLQSLRDQLLAPDLYKAFAEVFYAEINRLRMSEGAHITVAQRELAQIGRKLGQLVAAIADGGPARALMVEVHRLEARQGELEGTPPLKAASAAARVSAAR